MVTYVITMVIKTKVRKIGNSLGIVLPKEALQAMNVEEGATMNQISHSFPSSLFI